MLKKSRYDYRCAPSKGSVDNIRRVLDAPDQIGFSQFDIYADQRELLGGDDLFTMLRGDLGNEVPVHGNARPRTADLR